MKRGKRLKQLAINYCAEHVKYCKGLGNIRNIKRIYTSIYDMMDVEFYLNFDNRYKNQKRKSSIEFKEPTDHFQNVVQNIVSNSEELSKKYINEFCSLVKFSKALVHDQSSENWDGVYRYNVDLFLGKLKILIICKDHVDKIIEMIDKDDIDKNKSSWFKYLFDLRDSMTFNELRNIERSITIQSDQKIKGNIGSAIKAKSRRERHPGIEDQPGWNGDNSSTLSNNDFSGQAIFERLSNGESWEYDATNIVSVNESSISEEMIEQVVRDNAEIHRRRIQEQREEAARQEDARQEDARQIHYISNGIGTGLAAGVSYPDVVPSRTVRTRRVGRSRI